MKIRHMKCPTSELSECLNYIMIALSLQGVRMQDIYWSQLENSQVVTDMPKFLRQLSSQTT